MGWFNKKKKEGKEDKIPSLPEIPKLPVLPRLNVPSENPYLENKSIPQLPSYPRNSFDEKFSQNAIKGAVSGEKEDEFNEVYKANESFKKDEGMMPTPYEKIVERNTMPSDEYISSPKKFTGTLRKTRNAEPVFIRMDKFEESLEVFENAKSKVKELEEMLRGIKKIKEEEERGLQEWETEIQNIKGHLDKLDRDLFSKL